MRSSWSEGQTPNTGGHLSVVEDSFSSTSEAETVVHSHSGRRVIGDSSFLSLSLFMLCCIFYSQPYYFNNQQKKL